MATPAVSGLPAIPAATGGSDYGTAMPTRRPPANGGSGGHTGPGSPALGAGSGTGAVTSLDKAIAQANNSLRAWSTGMRFDVDPGTGRLVVSITDSKTGAVLRTIPTEAVLRVAKMIMRMEGKTIDAKV